MTEVRQEWREFLQCLQVDICKRVKQAGTSIESLMEAGKVREACVQILWWYIQVRGAQAPPTTYALNEVTVDRV